MARGCDEVLACYGRLHREFEQMAPAIIQVLTEELGDRRVTFPGRRVLERIARDRQIRVEFNGSNLHELALKYEISPRRVRAILRDK